MHILTLKIEDTAFEKVISFLQHLPKSEVVIIEDKTESLEQKRLVLQQTPLVQSDSLEEIEWEYWNDEEIENFGMYAFGLSSNDYDDEDEDYTQW